tara:strand:- start:8296 stop:8538 length:243 start_codon:yes stop_codon:yes gene_type:complete
MMNSIWKLFFNKKEKQMATTDNKTTAELKKTLAKQDKTISAVLNRISALSDEISSIKNELKRFKGDVAGDVKYLTDRVDG